jgi:hypothetical protein
VHLVSGGKGEDGDVAAVVEVVKVAKGKGEIALPRGAVDEGLADTTPAMHTCVDADEPL